MTYYDEIFNKVVSEGEKRLEKERRFKIRIKRMSAAISGICAVAVIGAVIYSGASPKQLTAPPTNSGIIVTENETKPVSEKTETTTKSVITTAVTTGATNTNKTTTVQTQLTTKPQQTVTSKIQTTAVTTTINTPVQTTIIEETTDKPLELVTFESGTVKPYYAPVNKLPKDMPTVILDGREVKHKNVNNCDDMEICFRVGTMDFGLERFNYAGIYESMCDEFGLDSYETGTDTKFQYDIETDTVYSVDITYYRIPDYLGAYYYAVKFPNSEQIYLYRFYKELYYDSEKGEYLEVKDPNDSDENTEFFTLTHEDKDFFKYFETIKYGRRTMKFDGEYCKYSESLENNFKGYNFFKNFFKDLNQVYESENCMVFAFDELEDAIVVRFGYDDVCYLYRIAE